MKVNVVFWNQLSPRKLGGILTPFLQDRVNCRNGSALALFTRLLQSTKHLNFSGWISFKLLGWYKKMALLPCTLRMLLDFQ